MLAFGQPFAGSASGIEPFSRPATRIAVALPPGGVVTDNGGGGTRWVARLPESRVMSKRTSEKKSERFVAKFRKGE